MQWTLQRKITGAILTLAGMGFGTDQLFLSNGSEPSETAARTAGTPTAKNSPSAAKPIAQQAPQSAALLARRLEQASSDAGYASTGDAFRPPAAWFPKPDSSKAQNKTASTPALAEAGLDFKAKHRLIGVMRSGQAGSKQGLAVIAGPSGSLTVRVGESIDGVTLTGVEDGRIRMTENGREFSVDLPRPGFGTAASAQ